MSLPNVRTDNAEGFSRALTRKLTDAAPKELVQGVTNACRFIEDESEKQDTNFTRINNATETAVRVADELAQRLARAEAKLAAPERQLTAQLAGLLEIQRLLDEAYDHYFEHSDGYSKNDEGHIEINLNKYSDRKDGQPLRVTSIGIFSYVFGPHRMHDFETVDQALTAVREWHRYETETDYSDGGPCLPVEKLLNTLTEEALLKKMFPELHQDTEKEPDA